MKPVRLEPTLICFAFSTSPSALATFVACARGGRWLQPAAVDSRFDDLKIASVAEAKFLDVRFAHQFVVHAALQICFRQNSAAGMVKVRSVEIHQVNIVRVGSVVMSKRTISRRLMTS